jgi:hypothetical protein
MRDEKLIDRTSVVLTDDLKKIIHSRAEANDRSFSQQLRHDLKDYYKAIQEGVNNE